MRGVAAVALKTDLQGDRKLGGNAPTNTIEAHANGVSALHTINKDDEVGSGQM
jgi:hypothetical protein